MFKKYLRIQPVGLQLSIFLLTWVTFTFLFSVLQPLIIHLYGLNVGSVSTFLSDDLFNYPDLVRLLNALGAIFVFLIPAALFAYLASPQPFEYIGFKRPENRWHWLLIAIMGIGLVLTITTLGGWLKTIDLGETAKALNKQRESNFKNLFIPGFKNLFINLFYLALLPAISEELFFRGIIQKFAYSFTKRPYISILISGLVFALMHFSIYEFIPIFLAGLLLAWVYYISSSIYLCILLHFLNNGIQVVMVYLGKKNPSLENFDQNNTILISLFITGLVVLAITIFKMKQTPTPLPLDWSVKKEEDEEEEEINNV